MKTVGIVFRGRSKKSWNEVVQRDFRELLQIV